jgi:hypothetical protein
MREGKMIIGRLMSYRAIVFLGAGLLVPAFAADTESAIHGALPVTSVSVEPQHDYYVAKFTVTCYSTVPISAFAVTFTSTSDDGTVTTKTNSLDMVSTIPLSGTSVRSSIRLHLGLLRAGDSDEFTAIVGKVSGHAPPVVHADTTGIIFEDGKWVVSNTDAQRYLETTFRMRTHLFQDYSDQLDSLRTMRAKGEAASDILAALHSRAGQRNKGGGGSTAELDLAERNAKLNGEAADGELTRYEGRLEKLIEAYRTHVQKGDQLQ